MSAVATKPVPILPAFVPKVYAYLDPIPGHNQQVATEYAKSGFLGLMRRWGWPAFDRGAAGIVMRLIGFLDGAGGQPHEHPDLCLLLRLARIVAYSRVPPDDAVCDYLQDWSFAGGVSWIEGSGLGLDHGVPVANPRQVTRDIILRANPSNKSETWPDRLDVTDGIAGGLVIQDTQWTAPWPTNFKSKNLKPPGGVVNWLDWNPKDLALDIAGYFARCASMHQDCCIGADLIVDRGVTLPSAPGAGKGGLQPIGGKP